MGNYSMVPTTTTNTPVKTAAAAVNTSCLTPPKSGSGGGGGGTEELDENDEIELMFGSFDEAELSRSLKKSRSQLGVNLIHDRAWSRDPAGGGGRFSFSKR